MTQAIIIPATEYEFDPLNQKITFLDNVFLEGFQLITNLATGEIIYQFNNSAKSADVTGKDLNLSFDTTTMSSADPLQIIYNPPRGGFFDTTFSALTLMINSIVRQLNGIVLDTALGRKVQAIIATDSAINAVNAVTTVTTVSTVASATNLVNLGLLPAENAIRDLEEINYNTGIRSKII